MRNVRVTQPAWSGTRHRGFTMSEMVVAVTIMVVVTAVVASLFVQVRKMISLTQWSSETRAQLRTTVNTIAEDLHNIDDQAYFLMLNRDYGTYDPLVNPNTNPPAVGCQIYPGTPGVDVKPAQKRIPADRIAFISKGPFNTPLPLQQAGQPAVTAARVYYGHSLWTHDVVDNWWRGTLVSAYPNLLVPLVTPPWPADVRQRPAAQWELVRQAILHVEDSTVEPAGAVDPFVAAGPVLSWRMTNDFEYRMLHNDIGAFTPQELTAWIEAQVAAGQIDWAALLYAPCVRQLTPTGGLYDPNVAPARLLLPQAASVRFQVRLSDGTVLPKTYDDKPTGGVIDEKTWLRGALLDVRTANAAGANSITALPAGFMVAGAPQNFSPFGNIAGTQLSDYDVWATGAGAPPVPTLQFAYIWTAQHSNLTQAAAQPVLYPVALRVRIDVYDPEKRTPDPVRIDEWLPIRWRPQ